jgi:hypothetical protein
MFRHEWSDEGTVEFTPEDEGAVEFTPEDEGTVEFTPEDEGSVLSKRRVCILSDDRRCPDAYQ